MPVSALGLGLRYEIAETGDCNESNLLFLLLWVPCHCRTAPENGRLGYSNQALRGTWFSGANLAKASGHHIRS